MPTSMCSVIRHHPGEPPDVASTDHTAQTGEHRTNTALPRGTAFFLKTVVYRLRSLHSTNKHIDVPYIQLTIYIYSLVSYTYKDIEIKISHYIISIVSLLYEWLFGIKRILSDAVFGHEVMKCFRK